MKFKENEKKDLASMNNPKCILITGRPGSGKTTLTDKLSKHLYIPKISRDELKEGYVNTFGIKHDLLPKDTNEQPERQNGKPHSI